MKAFGKTKPLRKIIAILLALAAFAIASYVYINVNLRPALIGLSEARVRSITANAMNNAIAEIFQKDGIYDSLVTIYENGDHVYCLQANSGRINALSAECAQAVRERLSALGEQGISIAVGTITGIPLLSGRGPKLTVSFTPAGSVRTSFESNFHTAGINQTLHRINLHLSASVHIILPGISHTVEVTSEAVIAENIIIGNVPNSYTQVLEKEDVFDLVPDGG